MDSKTKPLFYKHISKSVDQSYEIYDDRREGRIKSLSTGKRKLDEATMNGLEWWRMLTIAGMSGAGKSTTIEELKYNLIKHNPNEKFDILSFELEMLSTDQIGRRISGRTGYTIKDLYSINQKLSDEMMSNIRSVGEELKTYPIYYVDYAGTVEQIISTILDFTEKQKLKETKKGLVVTIDHYLLVQGKQGQTEKKIIDDLCRSLVLIKKLFASQGIKILIIMVAQLNRGIEDKDRITNASLNYPMSSDIFGASSVYQASDYVLVTHKPSLIKGLTSYGPSRLPIYNPENKDQAMIYWHLLKNRFGEPAILKMVDNFSESKVGEYYK